MRSTFSTVFQKIAVPCWSSRTIAWLWCGFSENIILK